MERRQRTGAASGTRASPTSSDSPRKWPAEAAGSQASGQAGVQRLPGPSLVLRLSILTWVRSPSCLTSPPPLSPERAPGEGRQGRGGRPGRQTSHPWNTALTPSSGRVDGSRLRPSGEASRPEEADHLC